MKFYLAGPVGYGTPGTEWKDKIKALLRRHGHEVYDPIENDHKYPEVSAMNVMKDNPKKHQEEVRKIMQPIFWDDCAYITDCDYVICYFVGNSLGTSSEQGIAYYLNRFLGKNVKTLTIFDRSFHPDEWVLCCSHHVFFSINDCIRFLEGLCDETLCDSDGKPM